MPTHIVQCWRADLSQFPFSLEHRPETMMTERNLLSRYNMGVASWVTAPTITDEPDETSVLLAIPQTPTVCLFSQEVVVRWNPCPWIVQPMPLMVYRGDPL
jgi:hypothetical protein